MTWLVPMDSSGFLVSYDTSIFTLALKLSRYNLRKIDFVNTLKELVPLKQISVVIALTLNQNPMIFSSCETKYEVILLDDRCVQSLKQNLILLPFPQKDS